MHYVEHEKDRPRAPSTLRDYASTISHHLEPRFTGTLTEITVQDITDFRRDLLGTSSRRTAQKTLILLHGIFKHAVREGWMTANPVAGVERITITRRPEFAVLTVEEVMALARATPTEQDAALITVAAFTGLRLGELRSLRWRDVAWSKRYVHVRRSYTGKGEKAPKSGKARSVPLSDPVARVLDALSQREQHTGPDDRVFCTTTGDVLDDGQIRDMFYRALDRAGIDRDRGTGQLLRFHEYADVVVMPMSLRRGCSEQFSGSRCRHNQSASRKARSASGGW
jgi:integrase